MTQPPTTPEFLNWSDTPITFDKRDHPRQVPRPGHSALVLDAQICGYDMTKVFMDGGSGINLIFASTLRAMNLSTTSLEASETSFHGIVPGEPNYPIGKIGLDLVFGTEQNFRRERIEFEVVDWPSQYHTILGRPTFARFMAVPHYAYLQLKMPGRHDVITVHGSFTKSDNCDREFNRISQSFEMQEELVCLQKSTDHTLPMDVPKRSPEDAFNSASETRAVQVHPTDSAKKVIISTSLDDK